MHIDIARRYFYLLESFTTDISAYRDILHPAIEQTEYPNAVVGQTVHRTLEKLNAGMEAGKKLLSSQKFDIRKFYELEDSLIIEAVWSGQIGESTGDFLYGKILTAYICIVMEFRDGKIYRQRNYDCYERF